MKILPDWLKNGYLRVIDPVAQDGSDPDKTLLSVGAGVRYTMSKNFALRFDYGFPLMEKDLNEHPSRGHIGLLVSF